MKAYIEKRMAGKRELTTTETRANDTPHPAHAFTDSSHGVRIGTYQKPKESTTLYDLVEVLPKLVSGIAKPRVLVDRTRLCLAPGVWHLPTNLWLIPAVLAWQSDK